MSVILITGATGNVGAAIIQALCRRQIVSRAGIRTPENYPKKEYVLPVRFDFAQPSTYKDALAGVRKVFLMRPPAIANTKALIHPFIDSALEAGVEHIVFLSLLGAEHNRFVPHRAIEDHIISRGGSYTFLRAGFFMQNLDTTHRLDVVEHDEIFLPAGNGITSFIDVRDLAAVGALALVESGHEKKAYSLTGDVALDYFDAARIFSDVLGRPIRYANPSPWAFVRRWRRRGASWDQVLRNFKPPISPLTRLRRPASLLRTCALARIRTPSWFARAGRRSLAAHFPDPRAHVCIGAGQNERKLTQNASLLQARANLRLDVCDSCDSLAAKPSRREDLVAMLMRVQMAAMEAGDVEAARVVHEAVGRLMR